MANQYWQERIQLEIKNKLESDVEINKALSSLYKRHLKVIEKEVESFYQKYASKNRMSINEVKKKAHLFDVQSFAEKAAEYVRTKDFSPEANEKLALYNMKMRVNRLELLQYNIELEMVSLGNEEFKMTQKFLNHEFIQEMNAQAGILGEFVPDVKMIHQMADGIISVPFHGATWSENIWKRQDLLRGYVGNLVNTAIIQGKSPVDFMPELKAYFNASTHEAKRLAITETARVQSAVQKSMMEVNGFEQYEFIAEPSACKHCAALDGKLFDVDDMEPGKNCAPIHPFCRCSSAPIVSRKNIKRQKEEVKKNKGLNTYEDPVREIMGSAINSHPFETMKLLDELKDIGVKVIYSDKPGMNYQPLFNRPGQIRLDRESSYSALLHEYTHAIDDFQSGWEGNKYLFDDLKMIEWETRAYDAEIEFCRLNDVDEKYIIRLEKLKQDEIKRIESRWSSWEE